MPQRLHKHQMYNMAFLRAYTTRSWSSLKVRVRDDISVVGPTTLDLCFIVPFDVIPCMHISLRIE